MKLSVIAVCLVLPSFSAAQTACPADPKVYRCLNYGACDLEGRREFVQLLLDHDEQLLAAIPDLTPEERESYRTEIYSGDADRFRDAVHGDVRTRMSVRDALGERRRRLRAVSVMLDSLITDPQRWPGYSEVRRGMVGAWLRLGHAYAESSWFADLDRLRHEQAVPGAESSGYTLQDDLQTCSMTTQAVLQITLDDFPLVINN